VNGGATKERLERRAQEVGAKCLREPRLVAARGEISGRTFNNNHSTHIEIRERKKVFYSQNSVRRCPKRTAHKCFESMPFLESRSLNQVSVRSIALLVYNFGGCF